MKISKIKTQSSKISFKRALNPNEINDYKQTLSEARNVTGQTGKSIFIMPTSCLPQTKELNTGIGHIASPKAQEFFEYMHNYLGFNVVEDLPAGQIRPVYNFYCAYKGSALELGNHQICPELLATDEYHNLLSKDELIKIVNGNVNENTDAYVNFKNVIDADGMQNKVLKNAFRRFKKLDSSLDIKKRYSKFIEENQDWLNFKRENEPDIEFFKFKQFLAEEHLKKGKNALNSKGIKLAGDCLIGFSHDEVNAFPNAFKKNHFIGMPDWGLPALNYDTILDETSDSAKLLKRKIQLHAQRYDVIRFDVGWAYVTPIITPKGEKSVLEKNRKYLNEDLLNLVEKWVKEVKGDDFDLKNLIYEFEASPDDFRAFDNNGNLIPPLKNRVKIHNSTYMHNYGTGWGYNQAFLNRGWSPDSFIIGVGNHDQQPLRQIATGTPEEIKVFDTTKNQFITIKETHKKQAIAPLSEELKISAEKLQNPIEFAKAKFAEPMMAKNNMYFYMDVFGREERFDMQGFNTTIHPEKNYAYKVPENYQKAYHSALQEGFGFNIMDSLSKVFKAKGYDKTHSALYQKIEKYREILISPEIQQKIEQTMNPKKQYLGKIATALLLLIGCCGFAYKQYSEKKQKTHPKNLQNDSSFLQVSNYSPQFTNNKVNNKAFSLFQLSPKEVHRSY